MQPLIRLQQVIVFGICFLIDMIFFQNFCKNSAFLFPSSKNTFFYLNKSVSFQKKFIPLRRFIFSRKKKRNAIRNNHFLLSEC